MLRQNTNILDLNLKWNSLRAKGGAAVAEASLMARLIITSLSPHYHLIITSSSPHYQAERIALKEAATALEVKLVDEQAVTRAGDVMAGHARCVTDCSPPVIIDGESRRQLAAAAESPPRRLAT